MSSLVLYRKPNTLPGATGSSRRSAGPDGTGKPWYNASEPAGSGRPEVSPVEVGKRIRAVRQQRGMSLRDLAHKSGVSKAYLSQLENDPGRRPSVDVVVRIAEALGVSVLELLDRGGAEEAAATRAGTAQETGAPAGTAAANNSAASPPGGAQRRAGADHEDNKSLDPEELPPALRLFWEEHPYVTEDEIRSLANITWCGRRPFTPTDYWVLHQVLSGMLRDT